MVEFSLADRTAIVTGGSRGIGFAIAKAFVAAGARVVITARGEGPLREAAASLGPNAIAMPCDNADPASIERVCDEAWALGQVHVLVNNAGISPYYKKAEHVTVDEFDSVIDVNLRGTYLWSTAQSKRLQDAGVAGSIINVSSILGVVPGERLGVYSATKAGIHQLTKVFALEWAAKGIRVNAIAPGFTETDFTEGLFASRHAESLLAAIPMGRWATPDDIAGTAVYLASDASTYVTGAIIPVDGGRALR